MSSDLLNTFFAGTNVYDLTESVNFKNLFTYKYDNRLE